MKKTPKKEPEKHGPDFTLNIFPASEPESRKDGVIFVVQTTRIFVSFQYTVLLEHDLKGRTLRLRIKGLHAPELLMPGGGPAVGKLHIPDMSGHYQLIVVKQDRSESAFDIDVKNDAVTILRSPPVTFVAVSNEKIAV